MRICDGKVETPPELGIFVDRRSAPIHPAESGICLKMRGVAAEKWEVPRRPAFFRSTIGADFSLGSRIRLIMRGLVAEM